MDPKKQLVNSTSKLPLIVYYQGNYKDVPTETIINIIESSEKSVNRKAQLRKLMFLSVEAIQNIQRYSAHQDQQSDFSLIFCDGNSYQVLTQNLIHNKGCEELKGRLEGIMAKSAPELDELYMSKIDSEEHTEKGAGLGLIEMARKSNNNIRYELKKVDENFSLFNLQIVIPADKRDDFKADFLAPTQILPHLSEFSQPNKSSFYYGGDFSNNFITSLLNLLLSKRAESTGNANKKVHHVLIELIQNIKKHSQTNRESADARLFVEWQEACIKVTAFNKASIDSVNDLQKKVVNLNGCSKEQLNAKSKEVLSDLSVNNGLGLIDMANLIFPNKLEMNSKPIDNEQAELFFTVKINND